MRSLLCVTSMLLLLLAVAHCNAAGLTTFVDDKREGELPIDDASPQALLAHASLATFEARTKKNFRQNVIAVLPQSSGPGTASEKELWKSQDAMLKYASKINVAVGDYLTVYRSTLDSKPFYVERIEKEQFNRTFVRNLQAKKTAVVSMLRFDRKDFPTHEEIKSGLLSTQGVSDLVLQVSKAVKKFKLDGIVFDMSAFQFSDLGSSRAILTTLKKLTKTFANMQGEEDEPHQVGILLRNLDHFSYKEWLNVQDAVDFFIIGARTGPVADQIFPNPTVEEAADQITTICRTCGTKKMKKIYRDKVAISFDMLGHSAGVGSSGYGTRFPLSQFMNALELSKDTDCGGNTDLAHPVEVTWNEKQDEFEYVISRDVFTAGTAGGGSTKGSECLPKSSGGKVRMTVPTLKSFKLHLDSLTKMRSAIAIWNFGLGHKYLFEIL